MITIGKRTFEIARTEFSAYVSIGERGWAANWNIEIDAKPLESADMRWEPALRSYRLLDGLPHPLELSGKRFGPLANDESGEPAFLLSDFEHDPVREPVFRFKERRGSEFLFEFRGKVSNFTDESDEATVFLGVDCWLPFQGAYVDEFRVEQATQRLHHVFGPSGWTAPIPDGNRWLYKLRTEAQQSTPEDALKQRASEC